MTSRYDFAAFKQTINLTQYAASVGYSIDRRKSTKSSVVMRHTNGDKIIVSRRGQNWVYFSVHDNEDNGTIVSFIERRTGKRMAAIGQELQAWAGGEGASPPLPAAYMPEVEQHRPDRNRVRKIFRGLRSIVAHPYLMTERAIPQCVLSSPRFRGCIYSDRYGNAVFPHYDCEGLCGLELKNIEKGLLVKGSTKGLWTSNITKTDRTLVIAEVAIDALSYAAIFMKPDTAYAAVSGGMGPHQYPVVMQTVRKMPNLETIILATDNDTGGDSIADKLEAYLKEQGFAGEIKRHSPEARGEDWNEVLKMLPF